MKTLYLTAFVFCFLSLNLTAQKDTVLYAKNTIKVNRIKDYRNLVNNSINKNLSLRLTDSTEENWEDAFMAMELIRYRSPWADKKIRSAFDSIEKRRTAFQRAFIELIYTNYPKEFIPQILSFLKQTNNPKLFAMCAEYLLMNSQPEVYKDLLLKRMDEMVMNKKAGTEEPIFKVLQNAILYVENYL